MSRIVFEMLSVWWVNREVTWPIRRARKRESDVMTPITLRITCQTSSLILQIDFHYCRLFALDEKVMLSLASYVLFIVWISLVQCMYMNMYMEAYIYCPNIYEIFFFSPPSWKVISKLPWPAFLSFQCFGIHCWSYWAVLDPNFYQAS